MDYLNKFKNLHFLAIFEPLFFEKMGPTLVTSTFLHFKKLKKSFKPSHYYAKIIVILSTIHASLQLAVCIL